MTAMEIRIGEALSFGWRAFAGRPLFWIGVVLIYVVIEAVFQGIDDHIQSSFVDDPMTGLIATGIHTIVYVFVITRLTLGLYTVYLATVDGGRPAFRDLMANGSRFWRYLGASIVFYLLATIGFVLLIVPGLYVLARFGFYGYAVIDQQAGPIEALETSSRITEGLRWPLVLFALTLIAIVLVGALALLIGLFVAMPVAALAHAYIYRRLAPAAQMGIAV